MRIWLQGFRLQVLGFIHASGFRLQASGMGSLWHAAGWGIRIHLSFNYYILSYATSCCVLAWRQIGQIGWSWVRGHAAGCGIRNHFIVRLSHIVLRYFMFCTRDKKGPLRTDSALAKEFLTAQSTTSLAGLLSSSSHVANGTLSQPIWHVGPIRTDVARTTLGWSQTGNNRSHAPTWSANKISVSVSVSVSRVRWRSAPLLVQFGTNWAGKRIKSQLRFWPIC